MDPVAEGRDCHLEGITKVSSKLLTILVMSYMIYGNTTGVVWHGKRNQKRIVKR